MCKVVVIIRRGRAALLLLGDLLGSDAMIIFMSLFVSLQVDLWLSGNKGSTFALMPCFAVEFVSFVDVT